MNTNIFTIKGEKCKFPFMFEMNKYNECTSDGSNQQWAYEQGANPGDKWCMTESGEKQFCKKIQYTYHSVCPKPYNQKNLVNYVETVKKNNILPEKKVINIGSGKITPDNDETDNLIKEITTEEPSEIPVSEVIHEGEIKLGSGKTSQIKTNNNSEIATEIPLENVASEIPLEVTDEPSKILSTNEISKNTTSSGLDEEINETNEKIKVLTTDVYDSVSSDLNESENNIGDVVYNFFDTNVNYITDKQIKKYFR